MSLTKNLKCTRAPPTRDVVIETSGVSWKKQLPVQRRLNSDWLFQRGRKSSESKQSAWCSFIWSPSNSWFDIFVCEWVGSFTCWFPLWTGLIYSALMNWCCVWSSSARLRLKDPPGVRLRGRASGADNQGQGSEAFRGPMDQSISLKWLNGRHSCSVYPSAKAQSIW